MIDVICTKIAIQNANCNYNRRLAWSATVDWILIYNAARAGAAALHRKALWPQNTIFRNVMPATIAPITTHWYGQCAHDTLARYFFLSHHSPIRCRLFFLQQSIDFSVRILQIDLYAVLLTSDYYFCWYFLLMRCVYLTLYNIGNGAVQLIRIEMHWKLSLTNELNCKPKSNNLRYLGVKIGE